MLIRLYVLSDFHFVLSPYLREIDEAQVLLINSYRAVNHIFSSEMVIHRLAAEDSSFSCRYTCSNELNCTRESEYVMLLQ